MAPYLTEAVELVDREGSVRWRFGPPAGVLGHGARAGESMFAHAHPDDLPRMLEFGTAVLESEPGWRGSLPSRLHHADGTWRTYAIEVVNQLDHPVLDGIIVRTRELPTGPIVLEADHLDLSDEAMAESIAEAVPVALVVLDLRGRMEFANQAARAVCDLPDGPTHGRYLRDLAVEADRPGVARAVLRLIEARLLARGLADRPSTIIVTLDDVTERRREEKTSADAPPSTRSPVCSTAPPSSRRWRLAWTGGPLTAIYCDLDGFKSVNDTYGHAGGDELQAAPRS